MEQRWLPPSLVSQACDATRFAFEEFSHGQIRSPHTRKAYLHALRIFSDWCQAGGIALVQVTPGHVGRYLNALDVSVPTRKVHLAALRRFFDELVMRHVIILNPALSVRSERYQAVEGTTPEIAIEHARRLLKGLETTHCVGLRDRAVIGILIYTAARVGAVAKLHRSDFYEVADQYCLRFHEKGGKVREIPARHDLLKFIDAYLDVSGLRYSEPSSPLFRTAVRRTKRLTQNRMTADDMARMVNGACARRGYHSDGPGRTVRQVSRVKRRFYDYVARGVPYGPDDGTVAPWAVVASLPFAPEIVLPTIRHFKDVFPEITGKYCFKCSFNLTFPQESQGKPGWTSAYHYGINLGPVVLMCENYRSGLL